LAVEKSRISAGMVVRRTWIPMAVPVCFLTAVVMGEIPRPAGESAGLRDDAV
jgi:hypothetical protein